MPVIFSPGEPETRPLDPDAIVYTTAQKIADLLGIGPSEAVLMSANAEANGVFVTGGDYRNTGFSVGDTILIYSDADPLGLERDITAIATSVSGVKLSFSSAINPGLYETSDNAYVENQASFTNGKTRGITRDIVENHIKRIQDKIDSVTHNAWRPYLVAAEYINFDTYKPYRRRYYTDYVGTTPLLFRNVQQILRLELWQGDDYREIGSAEVRITLPDDMTTTDGKIAIGVGNAGVGKGSAALLDIGTTTTTWRKDFDKVTSAQNLADLINKEDRVNKAALEFAPTFTLEGSTSNVAVHNEFLATANADYGSGILKVTSMRQGKGGETCSIVASSGISLSEGSTKTATFSGLSGGNDIDVDSTADFAPSGVCIDSSGDMFSYESKTATQFTNCTAVSGSLVAITGTISQTLFQMSLQGGTGDQQRLKDWWMDYEMGIIYFNNSYPFFEWNAVKVAYIYGERYVEKAIEEATTKLVAADLLMSDDRSVLIPEGGQNIDLGSKVQLFRQEAEAILGRYKEVVVFA
jgi:hypothetical protein